jgi:hypothetical protein
MQSLSENKPLKNCLTALGIFTVVLAMEIMPDVNEGFELVLFPDASFRNSVVMTIFLDFGLCWLIEVSSLKFFG